MKRKAISLLTLAALLFLLLPGAASGATPSFTDIQNHWAKNYILDFASKGFVEGYPDKTFRPDHPISRAEFTCILLNSMGITPSANSEGATFSDTPTNWAHAQIAEAVQKGILVVSEYPDGLKPDGSILRSEAAAMMVRALGESPDTAATTFKDQDRIAKSMYRGFIKTASDAGLMKGYQDGTFRPFQSVTRAEACVMLSNLMNKLGGASTTAPSTTAPSTTAPSTTVPSTTVAPSTGSSLTGLTVQGNHYGLTDSKIYLRRNQANIPIYSIGLAGGLVYINGAFPFALNGGSNNPDLVVNNARYLNCSLSVSGSDLVAAPASLVLDSLTYNGSTYDSYYVKLYVGATNGNHYLSDAELVGQNTVEIAGTSYNTGSTQIAVALGSTFYAIQGINISSSGISVSLTATNPVVVSGLDLSDISAIFINSQFLNLNTINNLSFIIGEAQYNLSNVTIDASGNFTANGKSYVPDQVTMVVNNSFYKLESASIINSKFIFYCTSSSVASWAIVNNDYVDASTVQIICGTGVYALNNVLVVEDNVIRVNGQQYSASDLSCQINGTYYTIDDINYNSSMNIPTLETGQATGAPVEGLSGQPASYIFYLNSSVYQNGDSNTTINAGGTWAPFGSITFPDASHFTYNSATYSLVGAQVQINGAQFTISDTAWRVSSQVMEVYLQSA
jgi:hypothetical protein